jgi:hypothetical protein
MASKRKAAKPKTHGWEGHGSGKPPFPGAAPPIHTQKGGKYLKGKKKGTKT